MNILNIQAPLIAAVNGPVRLHSEYTLLADIVLATPTEVLQDKPHFELGIASGDTETTRQWGAVNEIVPVDKLLPHARGIAEHLTSLPLLTTSYTRIAMTQKLRQIIDQGVGYRLALDGISAADVARGRA